MTASWPDGHGRQIAPNLALDALVNRRRARGEKVLHLGFGEARLPVFPQLAEQLSAGAARNRYGEVAGGLAARAAVAGYLTRRGIAAGPDRVILAPGSKPLLFALHLVAPGDVIMPAPCWNTYAPQARLAGRRVHFVPIPPRCGGVPDPALLRPAIRRLRAQGADPRLLLLTSPDNPTGTFAPPDMVAELAAVAEAEDLLVISDEIYRDLLHDPAAAFTSPAGLIPDRTVVAGGLSKNLALGGWRIGFMCVPRGRLGEWLHAQLSAVASEIWSGLAGPMQQVAEYAFGEPPELVSHIAACARLHGAVAAAVYHIVRRAGGRCRPPGGGFYLYPDFESARGRFGITDAASLQHQLLERFGVAVLGGHHHNDDPAALRFRAATSMLYGDSAEEQRAALSAPSPAALPHIAERLRWLESALSELGGAEPASAIPRR